jgi:hypothetical protein
MHHEAVKRCSTRKHSGTTTVLSHAVLGIAHARKLQSVKSCVKGAMEAAFIAIRLSDEAHVHGGSYVSPYSLKSKQEPECSFEAHGCTMLLVQVFHCSCRVPRVRKVTWQHRSRYNDKHCCHPARMDVRDIIFLQELPSLQSGEKVFEGKLLLDTEHSYQKYADVSDQRFNVLARRFARNILSGTLNM